jgi:hypothetical protein
MPFAADEKEKMKLVPPLSIATLLPACATVSSPVPEGYKGAVVQLSDTGYQESGGKGAFFAALAVDEKDIDNAIRRSRLASQNHGFALTMRYKTRDLPVSPMKVRITGTHQTAAPIHELAARATGSFCSVEGVVDFKPVEGRSYVVTGELKKSASCAWIADEQSLAPVTEKVCDK